MPPVPNTRTALLAAIAANPADDLVRLVFAYWLDEYGDPAWAELIRLQCWLDPIRAADPPAVQAAEARERVLLADHARRIVAGFGYDGRAQRRRVFFRRGTPDRLRIPVVQFLRDGNALLDRLPTVRRLTLTHLPESFDRLSTYPALRRIERLDLAGWSSGREPARLMESPALARVHTVSFWLRPGDRVQNVYFPYTRSAAALGAALREVRLVQLHGGVRTGASAAGHDRAANVTAADPRMEAGDLAIRVIRPFARRFTLGSIPGPLTGDLPPVTPEFVSYEGRFVAVFWLPPHLGRFVDAGGEVEPGTPPAARAELLEELQAWWESGSAVLHRAGQRYTLPAR